MYIGIYISSKWAAFEIKITEYIYIYIFNTLFFTFQESIIEQHDSNCTARNVSMLKEPKNVRKCIYFFVYLTNPICSRVCSYFSLKLREQKLFLILDSLLYVAVKTRPLKHDTVWFFHFRILQICFVNVLTCRSHTFQTHMKCRVSWVLFTAHRHRC